MQAQTADKINDDIADATQDMIDSGIATTLDDAPSALYTKMEYSGESQQYLMIPHLEVLIPYGRGHNMQEELAHQLLLDTDYTSSQDVTDYPTITHKHMKLWYRQYTIIEELREVQVYKARTGLSGHEKVRLDSRANLKRGHIVVQKALKVMQKNPQYLCASPEKQRVWRDKVLRGEG
jgi:hypothetical protein